MIAAWPSLTKIIDHRLHLWIIPPPPRTYWDLVFVKPIERWQAALFTRMFTLILFPSTLCQSYSNTNLRIKNPSLHCDKSFCNFPAIARSAIGSKSYSIKWSEVFISCYSWLYKTELRTITSNSWEYSQVLL